MPDKSKLSQQALSENIDSYKFNYLSKASDELKLGLFFPLKDSTDAKKIRGKLFHIAYPDYHRILSPPPTPKMMNAAPCH